MSEKFFERPFEYKIYDEDIPLEDPNALGKDHQSLEIVEHLNWLAQQAYDDNHRVWQIERLVESMESAAMSGGLSPTAAGVAFIALESILKDSSIQFKSTGLESFMGGNTLIETSYAIEGFKEIVDKLKLSFKNKITKVLQRRDEMHTENLIVTGKRKELAEKLLNKLNNINGNPLTRTISLPTSATKFLPENNLASNISSMNTSFHDKRLVIGSKKVLDNLINFLEENKVKTMDDLQDFIKELHGMSPVEKIIDEITKQDFFIDKKQDDKKGYDVKLRNKHSLMGKVFLQFELSISDDRDESKSVIESTYLRWITLDEINKKVFSGEFKSLTKHEQNDCLKNIIVLCKNLKELKKDSDLETKYSGDWLYDYFSAAKDSAQKHDDFKIYERYIRSLTPVYILRAYALEVMIGAANKIIDSSLLYIDKSMRNLDDHPVTH